MVAPCALPPLTGVPLGQGGGSSSSAGQKPRRKKDSSFQNDFFVPEKIAEAVLPSFRSIANLVDVRLKLHQRALALEKSKLPLAREQADTATSQLGKEVRADELSEQQRRRLGKQPVLEEFAPSDPSTVSVQSPGPDSVHNQKALASSDVGNWYLRHLKLMRAEPSAIPKGSSPDLEASEVPFVGTSMLNNNQQVGSPASSNAEMPQRPTRASPKQAEEPKVCFRRVETGEALSRSGSKARRKVADIAADEISGDSPVGSTPHSPLRAVVSLSKGRARGKGADPAGRFRAFLESKFGSLQKAFAALDMQHTGLVATRALQQLLEASVADLQAIGVSSFQNLMKHLDLEDLEFISFSELKVALKAVEPANGEWEMMTTMQKWQRWCESALPANSARPPPWQAQDGERSRLQEKQDMSRKRMRRMIEQGLHKTKAGLRITAWHLPEDLSHDSVERYRREALEKVDIHSKRIKEALGQAARQRRELGGCVQVLQEFEGMGQLKDILNQKTGDSSVAQLGGFSFPRQKSWEQTVQTVNAFNEGMLTPRQREARQLARSLQVPIPDVEFIQSVFLQFDAGGGLDQRSFPPFFRAVSGEKGELDQRKLKLLWRQIDADHDNMISLREFVAWHVQNLKAPRLSSSLTTALADSGVKLEREKSE